MKSFRLRMSLLLLLSLPTAQWAVAQTHWDTAVAECWFANWYDMEECRLSMYMQRYPQSQLRDVYKYCFQDFFGIEHLITDSAAAARYIEYEINNSDTADWQRPLFYYPLLLNRYVRVDINYVRRGIIPLETMVSAMLRSAKPVEYDPERWYSRWQTLSVYLKNHNKPLNYEEDCQLIEQTIKSGKYAVHHSRLFNETYRQHYRIVNRYVFEAMLLPLIEASESKASPQP